MTMRIATMNAGTLAGRLGTSIALLHDLDLDVLCIQETRLSDIAVPSAQHWAKRERLHLLVGNSQGSGARAPVGGVAILRMAAIARVPLPGHFDPMRVLAANMHRPGKRPLLLMSVYLPANPRQ